MRKLNLNPYLMRIFAVILFTIIPFVQVNHTVVYILMELICLYGVLNFNREVLTTAFFKYYLWFFTWCIIVTLVSVKLPLSFKGLTTVMVPPLLLFGLYDGRLLRYIDRLLLWCSFILFLISLSFYLTIYLHANIPPFNILDDYGGGRITSSTLSLCIIVYTLFFDNTKKRSVFIIGLNIVSGLILKDGAFIFTLFITGFLYWALIKSRINIYKILISVLIIIGSTLFVLLYILHYNLHIQERFHIYSYWVQNIAYSPLFGTGLGLKLESWFYTTKFPIPLEIFKLDNHIALHAHNYLLDILLQTGIIGLGLLLFFFYKISREAYKYDNKYGFAVFFMLLVILMKNMVDDEIDGSRGLIYWFFIVTAYVAVKNKVAFRKTQKGE